MLSCREFQKGVQVEDEDTHSAKDFSVIVYVIKDQDRKYSGTSP